MPKKDIISKGQSKYLGQEIDESAPQYLTTEIQMNQSDMSSQSLRSDEISEFKQQNDKPVDVAMRQVQGVSKHTEASNIITLLPFEKDLIPESSVATKPLFSNQEVDENSRTSNLSQNSEVPNVLIKHEDKADDVDSLHYMPLPHEEHRLCSKSLTPEEKPILSVEENRTVSDFKSPTRSKPPATVVLLNNLFATKSFNDDINANRDDIHVSKTDNSSSNIVGESTIGSNNGDSFHQLKIQKQTDLFEPELKSPNSKEEATPVDESNKLPKSKASNTLAESQLNHDLISEDPSANFSLSSNEEISEVIEESIHVESSFEMDVTSHVEDSNNVHDSSFTIDGVNVSSDKDEQTDETQPLFLKKARTDMNNEMIEKDLNASMMENKPLDYYSVMEESIHTEYSVEQNNTSYDTEYESDFDEE